MAENTQKTECPQCHQFVNPGRFCEMCGGRLPAVDGPSAVVPPATGPSDVASPGDPVGAHRPVAEEAPLAETHSTIRPPAANAGVAPAGAAPQSPSSSSPAVLADESLRTFDGYGNVFTGGGQGADEVDGLPIRLAGKMSSEFLEGIVAPLPFRIWTTGVVYESVQLSICRDGKVLASAPSVSSLGSMGAGVSLNHTPNIAGRVNIRVRLVCRRSAARDEEVYESDDISVSVLPKENASVAPVTVNYAPTFSNVSVDRAADFKISGFGGELQNALPLPGETLEQRIRRLAMTASDRDYPLHIVSLPRRLTLWSESSSKYLHVMTGDSLRFGRTLVNDVVLRVFDKDGSTRKDDSRAISRIHFTVKNNQDACGICDGGVVADGEMKDMPAGARMGATYGTSVSGKRLTSCGQAVLNPNASVAIELAPDVGRPVLQLSAAVRKCSTCSRRSANCPSFAVSSLLLTRSDDAETYLAVWKCADLGDVLPELKGCFIQWDHNRFVLRDPEGGRRTLWPDMQIGVSGGVWIRSFKQRFL